MQDARRYRTDRRRARITALRAGYAARRPARRVNRTDINWTSGCISVDNDSIVELDHLMPLDSLVIIKP